MPIQLLLSIAFFLVSTSIGLWILFLVRKARASILWPQADARIQHLKLKYNSYSQDSSNRYNIDFAYTYTVDKLEYRNNSCYFGSRILGIPKTRMFDLEKKFNAGELLKVSYNPRNPSVSTIEPGVHKHLLVLGLFGAGLACISLYLLLMTALQVSPDGVITTAFSGVR